MVKKKAVKKTSNWKSIEQTFHRKALTFAGRKRQILHVLKYVGIVSVGVALLVGIVSSALWIKNNPQGLLLTGSSEPLQHIYFETDGVLTRDWLDQEVDLAPGVSLMAINIDRVQRMLLDHGQTKRVMVERIFPDALRIVVQEHTPLLRLVIKDAIGKKHLMMVSDQGHVYTGVNYSKELLNKMPFLMGVSLKRKDRSFEPIAGISSVADLLRAAREQAPHLYQDWKFISCQNFSGDRDELGAEILVHTNQSGILAFPPQDFNYQLQRLDMILKQARRMPQRISKIKGIDLTLAEPTLQYAHLDTRGARSPR